jgi:hypothetical protein
MLGANVKKIFFMGGMVPQAPFLFLFLWLGCVDAPSYAPVGEGWEERRVSVVECPGCAALRCELHALSAYEAGSEEEEREVFEVWIGCLREAGIKDPCLDLVPPSALFSERFLASDWAEYEACLYEAGTPDEGGCRGLLAQAQGSEDAQSRRWFLDSYAACLGASEGE